MPFTLTKQAERRLAGEEVGWLTTVTPQGKPAPQPVWFLWDGSAITVYSLNNAARLRNIDANPQVTLHFNSNASGGDVLVIAGTAQRLAGAPAPSAVPALKAKYSARVAAMGQDWQWYDDNYAEAVRITPERSWGHE